MFDPTTGGAWLPFAIFVARLVDVALGVLRNLYASSGMKWQAAVAGFFEIMLWVYAIAAVVNALDDPATILAFALGYSVGTMLGVWIEERIALGFRVVHVMNVQPELHLAALLREQGLRVTRLSGEGYAGPVEIVLAVIPRRRFRAVQELLAEVVPDAFYTIERVERPFGGSGHDGGFGVGSLFDSLRR